MAVRKAVGTGFASVWLLLCGAAVAEELSLNAVMAEPSERAATISYATNIPASGTVEYGVTDAYEHGALVDARLAREHSLRLVGLTPGTRYHYRASVTDASGRTVDSGDRTFTTRSIDTSPRITGTLTVATDHRGNNGNPHDLAFTALTRPVLAQAQGGG